MDGETIDWTESSTIPARETTLTGKVTWSAKNLPKGLKIDSKTGVISGYPTMPGDYAVRVTAKSGSQSETFDLKIGVGNLIDEMLPLMVLGESLRGFYLWERTGTYEDEKTGKETGYGYRESRPVVFAK